MGNAGGKIQEAAGHVQRKVTEAGGHVQRKVTEAGGHAQRKTKEAAHHVGRDLVNGLDERKKVVDNSAEALAKIARKIKEAGGHVQRKVTEAGGHAQRKTKEAAHHVGRDLVNGLDEFGNGVEKTSETLAHVDKKTREAAGHIQRKTEEAAHHVGRDVVNGAEALSQCCAAVEEAHRKAIQRASSDISREWENLPPDFKQAVIVGALVATGVMSGAALATLAVSKTTDSLPLPNDVKKIVKIAAAVALADPAGSSEALSVLAENLNGDIGKVARLVAAAHSQDSEKIRKALIECSHSKELKDISDLAEAYKSGDNKRLLRQVAKHAGVDAVKLMDYAEAVESKDPAKIARVAIKNQPNQKQLTALVDLAEACDRKDKAGIVGAAGKAIGGKAELILPAAFAANAGDKEALKKLSLRLEGEIGDAVRLETSIQDSQARYRRANPEAASDSEEYDIELGIGANALQQLNFNKVSDYKKEVPVVSSVQETTELLDTEYIPGKEQAPSTISSERVDTLEATPEENKYNAHKTDFSNDATRAGKMFRDNALEKSDSLIPKSIRKRQQMPAKQRLPVSQLSRAEIIKAQKAAKKNPPKEFLEKLPKSAFHKDGSLKKKTARQLSKFAKAQNISKQRKDHPLNRAATKPRSSIARKIVENAGILYDIATADGPDETMGVVVGGVGEKVCNAGVAILASSMMAAPVPGARIAAPATVVLGTAACSAVFDEDKTGPEPDPVLAQRSEELQKQEAQREQSFQERLRTNPPKTQKEFTQRVREHEGRPTDTDIFKQRRDGPSISNFR